MHDIKTTESRNVGIRLHLETYQKKQKKLCNETKNQKKKTSKDF